MKELNKFYIIPYVFFISAIILSTSGCFDSEPAIKISLEDVEQPLNAQSPEQPTRIAVSAMASPEETVEYYQEILDYISDRIGQPVELVQRESYTEINDLLEIQYLDAAFVCAGPYVDGHDKFKMELLAAPVAYGEQYYYSYIIVPVDSEVTSFEDLRGKRFAFTDPLSNTGKLVPIYMLTLMNETPDSYFSSYIYTHSHDRSIEAVAKDLVDGAAVNSLIWNYFNNTSPDITSKTKIITISEPFATPPVVVHPDADLEWKFKLKDILLTMHKDPRGAEILGKIGIARFTEIQDSEYDSVRRMNELVGERSEAG